MSVNVNDKITIKTAGIIENDAGTYNLNDDRIESQSFFSDQFSVADDSFVELGQGVQGFAFLMIQSDSIVGFAIISLGTSPQSITEQLDATNSFETALGKPTGTTGTDGDITVFADGVTNKFYLENRSGFTEQFKILLIN